MNKNQINTEAVTKDILNAMENCIKHRCFANGCCGECIYYNDEPAKCVPRLMKDAEGLIKHLWNELSKEKAKKDEIKRYLNRMYGVGGANYTTDLVLSKMMK